MTRGRFGSVARCSKAALLVGVLLLTGGCSFGGSRTRIIDAPAAPMKVSTMRIVEAAHTAEVPLEEREVLREKLETALRKDGLFLDGDAMTLEYRVTLYDPGDQFARYMVGMGAGEGEIIVEVAYKDPAGVRVARVECSGRLTMGSFGGNFRAAYDKAVEEIVTYAESNFHVPAPTPPPAPTGGGGAAIYD
ncbi:MAG: DUF4410 domain-containing protein [Planctomycetota bacterium]|jgi:hypothetical protein